MVRTGGQAWGWGVLSASYRPEFVSSIVESIRLTEVHLCTVLWRERHLHTALDRHLRMLRAYGIGVERRTADVITPEMEQKLWSLGILGICTPESLLNAVFFYNGKSFALRGVREQVELRFEQLVRMENPDRYTYYEYGSKNHSGGLALR